MKKLISIIISIIMCSLILVTGCGEKNPSPPPPITPTDQNGNIQVQENGNNDMSGRVVYGRSGEKQGIFSVDLLGRSESSIYSGLYDMASGDTNKVVFGGYKDNKWSIYTISSDGKNVNMLLSNYVLDYPAAINLKNNSIAFIGHDVKNGQTALYYMGVNDKNPKRLVNDSTVRDVSFLNENYLIYSKKVNENGQEIYQMFRYDLKNAAESRVLKTDANNICPTPSPDGKKIAFLGNSSGQYNIYALDTGTSKTEKLNGDDPVVRDTIRWSVNSNDVLYVTLDSDGKYKIRLSRVKEKTTLDIADGYTGAFSPSGTDVVYVNYDKINKKQVIYRKRLGEDVSHKVTEFSEKGSYSRSINLLFWTNQFGI